MIHSQRVFWLDDGTLKDMSLELNDRKLQSYVIDYKAASDYIYIGSEYPFNHRYFDVGVPNDVVSKASVDIWFAKAWEPALDELDRTAVAGVSLAQDGIIQWTTNRLKGWDIEQDSEDVTGLTGTVIYNFYWLRLSWSVNWKATTALNYVGHKFSKDDDLFAFYPDLKNTNLMAGFETGKTSWDEQHLDASEIILRDLRKKGIIASRSQILNYELFNLPSIHKTAEIIYQGMGKAYADLKLSASKAYDSAFDMKFFDLDKNVDARLNPAEKRQTIGFITR